MIIVGAGALARADGAAVLALAAKAALTLGVRQGRLERLQRAAHRGGARRRRSISASCRARAGSTRRRWRRPARSTCSSLLGADEIDVEPRRLRRLHRHPRRPRRASRRRHPAGRGLYREDRHLRQHRGPRAARRRAPSSRRARRARTGRSCARCPTRSARALPFDSLAAAARRARRRASASRSASTRSRRPMRPTSPRSPPRGGALERDAVRLARSPISTSPIRSRAPRAVMAECSALRASGRLAAGGGVGATT